MKKEEIRDIRKGTIHTIIGDREQLRDMQTEVAELGGRKVSGLIGLKPDLTISENILMGATNLAVYKYVMNELELSKLADKYPHQLLGSERCRAALAREILRYHGDILMINATEDFYEKGCLHYLDMLMTCCTKYNLRIVLFVDSSRNAYRQSLRDHEPAGDNIEYSTPIPLEDCYCA